MPTWLHPRGLPKPDQDQPSGLLKEEVLFGVSNGSKDVVARKGLIISFSFLVHYNSVYIENFLREGYGKCKSYLSMD